MANRAKASTIAANRAKVRSGKLQKPSERFATVDEIGAATSDSSTSKDVKKPEAPTRDLSDPKTQFRILQGGDVLGYTLQLEGGDREIEIRTTFTLKDELHRRTMENLESFRALLGVEISAFNPDHQPGRQPDWDWIGAHMEYLDAAMRLSHVRQRAREIVSRLSRFVGPDHEYLNERVTPAHLEDGMEHVQLSAATLRLLSTAVEASAERKKARAARVAPG